MTDIVEEQEQETDKPQPPILPPIPHFDFVEDNNPKEPVKYPPLYLPEGSIRALITIGLLVMCAYALGSNIPMPEWLNSLVSMCFGFYFGTRGSAK